MTQDIFLRISADEKNALWQHLLSQRSNVEEASFLFVVPEEDNEQRIFRTIAWLPIAPDGFLSRSNRHMELTDEERASVIKRAHDLNASLVEAHSHTGLWDAAFSFSDMLGFDEFVPHVRWRLKGKPYFALVLTKTGFDGLVWIDNTLVPSRLEGLLVGDKVLQSSKLTRLPEKLHEQTI